jgi:peptidoglycan L-alanyl-D-glutamate endopeptidase CwlK
MAYRLSKRSLDRLQGVRPELVDVVKRAIEITKVDFAVTEGVRTVARQKELVAKGASQTMESKHIEGRAVDLVAYIGSRISWELNLYDDIADAMAQAARELGVRIRWGGAWHISDIAAWDGTMHAAMDDYVDLRRSQGRRPFIDGPHFELM